MAKKEGWQIGEGKHSKASSVKVTRIPDHLEYSQTGDKFRSKQIDRNADTSGAMVWPTEGRG